MSKEQQLPGEKEARFQVTMTSETMILVHGISQLEITLFVLCSFRGYQYVTKYTRFQSAFSSPEQMRLPASSSRRA